MPSLAARVGSGMPGSMQTRSPGFQVRDLRPVSTTVPAASWPKTIGALTMKWPDLAMGVIMHVEAADADRADAEERQAVACRGCRNPAASLPFLPESSAFIVASSCFKAEAFDGVESR